jgi:hypothetical protein
MCELGIEDLLDLPFRFSFNDVRSGSRMIGVLRVFVVGIDLGDIPDRVNVLPVSGEFEAISMRSDLFDDLERT